MVRKSGFDQSERFASRSFPSLPWAIPISICYSNAGVGVGDALSGRHPLIVQTGDAVGYARVHDVQG